MSEQNNNANKKVAVACAAFVASMVGMAYAAVPLYELFCQVTGYGGTTQRAETASDKVLDRTINVRFDANVSGDLKWAFKPKIRQVDVKLGETAVIEYEAENLAAAINAGTATFNVSPPSAGAYFNKLECFCFTEQALAAGEKMDMPVTFFVDPDLVNDPDMAKVATITLSYTFFPTEIDEDTLAELGENKQNETQKQPL